MIDRAAAFLSSSSPAATVLLMPSTMDFAPETKGAAFLATK